MVRPLRRTYHQATLRIRGRQFDWGARTYIMAIINTTPDSFRGDGVGSDVDAAVALAKRFESEGADIIDIGGESSRPGATPLGAAEELERVIPSLEAVREATRLPISIDTMHAVVAKAALAAGADMVNDIWGLRSDANMAKAAFEASAPLVAMHNQRGRDSHDVIGDIRKGFHETLRLAAGARIPRDFIILDPGFGFGWAAPQNFEMLRRLRELWEFELPLLVGTSRKSSIGTLLDLPVDERLEGTAATVALAIAGGADIVRVHDVREMRRVARISDAVVRANWAPA